MICINLNFKFFTKTKIFITDIKIFVSIFCEIEIKREKILKNVNLKLFISLPIIVEIYFIRKIKIISF